jgi:hypothetical protein
MAKVIHISIDRLLIAVPSTGRSTDKRTYSPTASGLPSGFVFFDRLIRAKRRWKNKPASCFKLSGFEKFTHSGVERDIPGPSSLSDPARDVNATILVFVPFDHVKLILNGFPRT